MSGHKYDNEVQPDNKFGHTLELLRRHVGTPPEGSCHLDLACGFGHIAEPIMDEFGLHYIGVDLQEDGLAALTERGREAHQVDLCAPGLVDRLREIIGGRPLASITFLDGLEHLTDGATALSAMGDLLAEHRAIGVTSVPNVTHFDVGVKTMLGQWRYTEAGLLDVTHYQLFSHDSLLDKLAEAGLHPIDRHDVYMASSDQAFPAGHLALSPSTPLSSWLWSMRNRAEPHGMVNQFVWALSPIARRNDRVRLQPDPPSDLFLSVIMRTQGRRLQELREALLCLSAQSCQDFEVLVVAHKTTLEQQKAVEAIIADQRPPLRDRIRLHLLDRGKRSAPLNLGLDKAKGRYIAVFDDDDVVMGDWVKEFRDAEASSAGQILRVIPLRQTACVETVRGEAAIRSVSAPTPDYAKTFQLYSHLHINQSPPIAWVFPRSVHTDFGLAYDESMTTTEDWEFLLRAAELAGVRDIGRGTSIYRWWETRESSRTEHSVDEWRQNQYEIARRIDAKPLLLPAGESREVRERLRELDQLRARTAQQEALIERLRNDLITSRRTAAQQAQRARKRIQAAQKKAAAKKVAARRKAIAAKRAAAAVPPPPPPSLWTRAKGKVRRALAGPPPPPAPRMRPAPRREQAIVIEEAQPVAELPSPRSGSGDSVSR